MRFDAGIKIPFRNDKPYFTLNGLITLSVLNLFPFCQNDPQCFNWVNLVLKLSVLGHFSPCHYVMDGRC